MRQLARSIATPPYMRNRELPENCQNAMFVGSTNKIHFLSPLRVGCDKGEKSSRKLCPHYWEKVESYIYSSQEKEWFHLLKWSKSGIVTGQLPKVTRVSTWLNSGTINRSLHGRFVFHGILRYFGSCYMKPTVNPWPKLSNWRADCQGLPLFKRVVSLEPWKGG